MENNERTRERILDLIRKMREHTVKRGCTPAEAAHFAAKCAEWIERYQVGEVELSAQSGGTAQPHFDMCENLLRTGKKVFNPGMTAVVSALSTAMCCKVILLYKEGEATYGIIGDSLDADYVCQISTFLVPQLEIMARMEGAEHGYEKAGLVRWRNQYLTGASVEIQYRIEEERKERSDIKEIESKLTSSNGFLMAGEPCTAVAVITGESIAIAKRAQTDYQHGREAGKRVGLHIPVEG